MDVNVVGSVAVVPCIDDDEEDDAGSAMICCVVSGVESFASTMRFCFFAAGRDTSWGASREVCEMEGFVFSLVFKETPLVLFDLRGRTTLFCSSGVSVEIFGCSLATCLCR